MLSFAFVTGVVCRSLGKHTTEIHSTNTQRKIFFYKMFRTSKYVCQWMVGCGCSLWWVYVNGWTPLWGVPFLFIHIHFSTQQPTPSPGRNVQIGNQLRRTYQKTRDAFSRDLTNLKRRGDTNVPTRRKNSRRVKKTASANAWRYYVRRANLFFAKNRFKKYFESHHNNQHNGQPGQQFAPRIAFFGWFGLFRFQNNRFNRRRVANVCRRNTDRVKPPNDLNTDFLFGDEHRVVFCRHERRVNVNSLRDNRVPFDHNPVNNYRIGFFEQPTRTQRQQWSENQKFTHFH